MVNFAILKPYIKIENKRKNIKKYKKHILLSKISDFRIFLISEILDSDFGYEYSLSEFSDIPSSFIAKLVWNWLKCLLQKAFKYQLQPLSYPIVLKYDHRMTTRKTNIPKIDDQIVDAL